MGRGLCLLWLAAAGCRAIVGIEDPVLESDGGPPDSGPPDGGPRDGGPPLSDGAPVDGLGPDGPHPDGRPPLIDAAPPADAMPAPDAGQPDPFGLIFIAESKMLNHPEFGQGLGISIAFESMPEEAVLEEVSGSPLGCKVWELGPAAPATANAGAVTIESEDDTDPVIPPCTWLTDEGYRCIAKAELRTAGDAISIVAPGDPHTTLTHPTFVTPFTADDVGRYLRIEGGTASDNNGAFPIYAVDAVNNAVSYYNTASVAEAPPTGAVYTVIAGLGTLPLLEDPGMLEDADRLTVRIAGGAGWPTSPAILVNVGDDFDLDAASAAALIDVPITGEAFALSCSGCAGGGADLTVVTIETTDGDRSAVPVDYVMPPAVDKRVMVRCVVSGVASSVAVPPEYMSYVAGAGATRILTAFGRVGVYFDSTGSHDITVLAGHVQLGFTDP